jgi:hypothetical protein
LASRDGVARTWDFRRQARTIIIGAMKSLRRCSTLASTAIALIGIGSWLSLRQLDERYDAAVNAELAALASEGLSPPDAPGPPAVNVGPAFAKCADAIGDLGSAEDDPTFNETNFIDLPELWAELAADSEKLAAHERSLSAVLAKFHGALPDLDTALANERIAVETDRSSDFPSVSAMTESRRVLDVLRARIAHDVRLGRPADGWPDVERLLRIAGAFDDQRFLLGFLIEVAYVSTACRQLQMLLARAPVPEAGLAERIDRLLERLDHPRVRAAVRGELDEFLRAVPPDGGKLLEAPAAKPSGLTPPGMTTWARLPRPLRRVTLLRDRARTAQLFAETVRALDQPFATALPRIDAIEADGAASSAWSSPIAGTVFGGGVMKKTALKEIGLRADVRSTRVILAAARAGVPEKSPLALEDPMVPGRPLGYRRTGRKVLVWSVGIDGVDDGGARPEQGESWYDRPGLDLAVEAEIAPVGSR